MSARDFEHSLVAGSIAAFAELLRRAGLAVSVSRSQSAMRALDVVDAGKREDAYWALRSTLLARHEDGPLFDSVFELWWSGPMADTDSVEEGSQKGRPGEHLSGDGRSGGGEDPTFGSDRPAADRSDDLQGIPDSHDLYGGEDSLPAGARSSASERLRGMNLRDLGPENLAEADELLQRVWRLPRRRTRRLRPDKRGSHLDRRATLRAAIRTGGHPAELSWRQERRKLRRIVVLVDISGSMEPYARPWLMLWRAGYRFSRRLEVFSFATRLTRITQALADRDSDRAIESLFARVPDWAGGTRIGDSLAEFNRTWGSLARGAVVVIVSDGWERRSVETLAAAMERLALLAYTVIWVNPLAGEPGYEPLAAGMASAMPYVDLFVSGHDLKSAEALVRTLASLPDRGGVNHHLRAAEVGR